MAVRHGTHGGPVGDITHGAAPDRRNAGKLFSRECARRAQATALRISAVRLKRSFSGTIWESYGSLSGHGIGREMHEARKFRIFSFRGPNQAPRRGHGACDRTDGNAWRRRSMLDGRRLAGKNGGREVLRPIMKKHRGNHGERAGDIDSTVMGSDKLTITPWRQAGS